MIPYVRTIEYLSPSSLSLFETEPAEFYFRRLGPPELAPPNEQGFPAAVGTAFDACVKVAVAGMTGLRCAKLETLLESVENERERAIPMGHELAVRYLASGALKSRISGFRSLEAKIDMEVDGIPVRGHLDADWKGAPFDWKVSGAGSPGSRSPRPGYTKVYDTEAPHVVIGPHEKRDESLEVREPQWATQLTIYGWLLRGKATRRPIRAHIDEIVVGKNGRVRVAQHDAVISVAFQDEVRARLRRAWDAINEQRVVDPELSLDTLRAIR